MKLILISLIFIINCASSPQVGDTIRIQERTESVTMNLDNASNDCLTENCKKAMKEAKELIKDSLDVMINKDTEIKIKQKEIDNSSLYTSVGKNVIWGGILLLIAILLYVFRNQILTLIKLVRPI